MLLRFEVSNHRSIMEPVELSMIAVNRDREAARPLGWGDEKALTVAGIYGANGSGKTNVLDGFAWLQYAIRASLKGWEREIPRDPFAFGGDDTLPTGFGLDIVVNGVRHRYELEVDASVQFEALYSYPQGRRRALFVREGNEVAFRRGTRVTGGGRELITSTTLVLSVASRLTEEIDAVATAVLGIEFIGVWPQSSMPPDIRIHRFGFGRGRHDWHESLLEVFGDTTPESPAAEASTRSNRDIDRVQALAMLRFADLGVLDVEVADNSDDEMGYRGRYRGRRLRLLHDVIGAPYPLELGEESNGTLAWLALMPDLLTVFQHGGTLMMDELDSSLHPAISGKLVEMFQDPDTNRHNAQLIFTTHDTSLLGHLNRDEVWLTDKGADGSTALTPLSDFRGDRVRKSTNLERGYLQGRFGGVPIVDQYLVREALGIDA
ncbi:MAG: ATP-binding protein [Acidimicrobiaceae bacterium]|nr:ATP-binding protein [Acidimicrobiaceae bacterium]